MVTIIFNPDDLSLGQIFEFKWNRHVIIRLEREFLYSIDIDYDPEFSEESSGDYIYKISYEELELYFLEK